MFIKTQLIDVSFPSPGDLPNSETEPRSPTLQVDSLPVDPQGKPKNTGVGCLIPSPADLPDPGIEPCSLYCRWILEGIVGKLFTVRDAEALTFHYPNPNSNPRSSVQKLWGRTAV